MKINLALTVILIARTIAENDDLKNAGDVEVKSATKEDDSKSESELTRGAESYTVPVAVVNDAVTESEMVRKANADDHKDDSRVERSTVSDLKDNPGPQLDEIEKRTADSEHITNRRSNEETTKSANTDDTQVKSGDVGDANERAAKPDVDAEKDDVLKKGEDAEQKDDLVRNAADSPAEEKSAAQATLDDAVEVLQKAAEVEDMSSFVAEGIRDLNANLNSRRMLNPIGTFLDAKSRAGDNVGVSDEDSVKSAKKPESLDSPRPQASETILPLMALPNKENFFLTPALPIFHTTHAPPIRRPHTRNFRNRVPSKMDVINSLEQKPFNALNFRSFETPSSFPQFSFTTIRPLYPLPLANLPNFNHMFQKPVDNFNNPGLIHQFPNIGYNRPLPIPATYGAPNYLQYNPLK